MDCLFADSIQRAGEPTLSARFAPLPRSAPASDQAGAELEEHPAAPRGPHARRDALARLVGRDIDIPKSCRTTGIPRSLTDS